MKNQAQLIAYVDRLPGGTFRDLRQLIDGPFNGAFGGLHVLPFFHRIDGADAGFDPIDHTHVDERLGTWDDVAALAARVDLMADVIVNHISRRSPQFQNFDQRGEDSPYAGLFLTYSRVFPQGARESDLRVLQTIRPGLPFTKHQTARGEQVVLWTTFTSEQIDIWLRKLKQSRETWLLENIETLSEECQLLLAERVESRDLPPGLQLAGTSTHRLSELIAMPALRRDFLFALAVLPIELLGLQHRRGDIADIARAMLAAMSENEALPQHRLSRAALDSVKGIALPGNLPQLRSVLLNALFKARFDGGNELPGEIQPKHFSSELALASPSSADTYVGGIVDQMAAKSLTMSELNQRIYAEALRRSDGRVSTAARMLGVTRPQFVYRARGIESGN